MADELVIPGLDQEDIGTLLNVRTFSQYTEMVNRIVSGTCPFCKLNPKLNVVIKSFDNWLLWKNPFPLAHTSDHYVIAPVEHMTHLYHMSSEDWSNHSALVDYVVNPELGIGLIGGAVATRFGDPRLNAGSIRHLHTNIIVPDGTGEVRVTLAKNPEDIEHKKKILAVFEKLRTGTPKKDLTMDEYTLVSGRLT